MYNTKAMINCLNNNRMHLRKPRKVLSLLITTTYIYLRRTQQDIFTLEILAQTTERCATLKASPCFGIHV